jgi:hypothetical protein
MDLTAAQAQLVELQAEEEAGREATLNAASAQEKLTLAQQAIVLRPFCTRAVVIASVGGAQPR